MPKTVVSRQSALKQCESDNGREVVSIVKISDVAFRYVHEKETYEPGADGVPAYWVWREFPSGIFESIEAAMDDAIREVPWLKSAISNRDTTVVRPY